MVKFSSIFFTAALAISVFANPLVGRGIKELQADLAKFDTTAKKLDTLLTAYNGGISGAFEIHTTSVDVGKIIKQTTTDAKAMAGTALSAADSKAAIDYINNSSKLPVLHSLQLIVQKKALFARQGVTDIVKDDLTDLRRDSEGMKTALVAICDSSVKPQANLIIKEIVDALATALAAYP